jgi:2',3'-cyclic-nucleotide 2'-phosphodiesterase (5'-nucleotidase family)
MSGNFHSYLLAALLSVPVAASAGSGEVTFIHIGDLHGHLIPRPNMREDDPDRGQMVGGVAYVYDQVKEIRSRKKHTLTVNTGDTIQGSAEALYTSGGAMVEVLNEFGIDAFAPGNWDFVYGTEKFRELFAGTRGNPPLANWNALAANLYYATLYEFPETRYARMAGTRVIKPWSIHEVGGLRIGIIGLTADRGPQAVSKMVTEGFYLTPGEEELANAVPLMRNEEKVDLVVLISERGLAANLELVETIPGVDIVLSSDMHEETHQVLVAKSGTLLIEEGQDGTLLGELTVSVNKGKMGDWEFTAHRINEKNNKPDPKIDAIVQQVRSKFVNGSAFVPHVNPMNASILRTPIDTVIGHTKTALHRANFSDAKSMPAVIEGSSHNFLADSFRGACESEIGMIRGFRYGTHIAPGPIKLEDIYHYIPIGPQIACGLLSGDDLRLMIQRGLQGSLTQWVGGWGGGWVIAFSGITYDVDPYKEFGQRASNIRVNGERLDPAKYYHVGGYWYLDDPGKINRSRALEIKVLKASDGGIVDATAVVAYYLRNLPNRTADPVPNRIKLLRPLPGPIGPNKEIQPLAGVIRPEYLAHIEHRSQERHISSAQLRYRTSALTISNQTIAAQHQDHL